MREKMLRREASVLRSSPESLPAAQGPEQETPGGKRATPQSGMQYMDIRDPSGKYTDKTYPGGKITYYVDDGVKTPVIIFTYNIPKK
jgi:hypothetical protein